MTASQIEARGIVARGEFLPALLRESDGWHARWVPLGSGSAASDDAVAYWTDEIVRRTAMTRLCEDADEQTFPTIHDAWLAALKSRNGLVSRPDDECSAFAAALAEWYAAAVIDSESRARTTFTFVSSSGSFEIACAAPTGLRAMRALGESVEFFSPLRGLRSVHDSSTGAPRRLAVELTRAEAESFIRSGAKALRDAGYQVEGVGAAAKVSAAIELETNSDDAAMLNAKDATVAARLTITVDGEEASAEEIRFLLEQKSSLVFFRDRWIEIDRAALREALHALDAEGGKPMALNTALRFAAGIGAIGHLEIEHARVHGWLRGLLNELRARVATARANVARGKANLAETEATTVPGLCGELRPYQARGVAWMKFLTEHGFGALLADDMGLGKTVQTITWMLSLKRRPILVVAPLTLLANWRREIARFAPSLKVYVHQGEERQLLRGFERMTADADVVVTSYSLLVKDYAIIRRTNWEGLVLDEAQAIKNPDTQAARAVRALGARRRIALTGTPIENTVADVWSLEEYLNPTFLGDRKSFVERFVKPIAADEHSGAGKRLRHALEPFVLRRLKSDSEIAGELGEKREIKEYCILSPEQRREYEAALEDYRASERRQGDIFALITRLKLICDGAGKFEHLYDLLESIFAAGESALVFTQYAKIGAQLRAALAKRFGRRFHYLYGGLSAKAREQEIAAFTDSEEPSAFVLSLRAGGFGLNLTKATHVIHFDRWWNPAVENQATDRAHRIGQNKTVFVHSFIAEGTLEERVDEILERKARVAGSLVQSGESFLMQMSGAELEEAVRLDV